MMKNIFLLGILILMLNSCIESEQEKSQYIYKNGESSVELKIPNGKDYLVYNTPTKINFEWKNIDARTGSIFGAGIKMLGAKDGITETEITVPFSYVKKYSLNIQLRFEIRGKKVKTEFNIPVKK